MEVGKTVGQLELRRWLIIPSEQGYNRTDPRNGLDLTSGGRPCCRRAPSAVSTGCKRARNPCAAIACYVAAGNAARVDPRDGLRAQ